MIAGKYVILYAEHPFNGCFDGEYATNHMIPFLIHFVMLSMAYPIVDVQFRNVKKMTDGDAK